MPVIFMGAFEFVKMKLFSFSLVLSWLVCVSPPLLADDITRDLRHNSDGLAEEDGGYLELGLGLSAAINPYVQEDEDCKSRKACINLLVGGAYHYRNAFIELADTTFDGLNIGYTLWEGRHWELDLIAANIFGDIDTDKPTSTDGETQKNYDLLYRSRLMMASGIRVTGYVNGTILQYRFVGDLFEEHGVVSSLRVGRSWQYRNWNFHALLSAEWFSSRTSNYWIGVTAEEATTRFPEYKLGSALLFTGEVGFAYPLAEHWVARAFWRYSPLEGEVYKSPLMDETVSSMLGAAISYAF